MTHPTHYLTIAAFKVQRSEEAPNEFTLDDEIPAKARVRKLCSCGSTVFLDEDQQIWACSESGVQLEILDAYCTRLLSPRQLNDRTVPNFDLQHSEIDSLARLDETGEIEVFLKVKAKDRWIITDPLPIFESLSIKPFEADLLVQWYLTVGHGSLGDLGYSIIWNVAVPLHQRILRQLASSKSVPLYFVDATSLSIIGSRLLELHLIADTVSKAFNIHALLPEDDQERREELNLLALGHEASHLKFSEDMGICPEIGVYLISDPSSKNITKLYDHIKNCSLCQRFNPN
jgi:hypothetical protein